MPQDGSNNYQYPPGTPGIPDQTIESEAYNTFLDDLVTNDLNIPRPIHRGGTGATDANNALANLTAEKATQLVADYGSHVWLPGSFYSATSATAAPVSGHAFAGIVYINEPLVSPPTNANVTVEARDESDTVIPGRVYVRQKKAGVWDTAWTVQDFVKIGGDTMTGLLTLSGNPTADMHATTKQYVDGGVAGIPGKVSKAGDTMTGLLTLSGNPTADMHATTKQYVDGGVAGIPGKVSKAGDIMTGLLTLSGNPTALLHAATKQYVDASAIRTQKFTSSGTYTCDANLLYAIIECVGGGGGGAGVAGAAGGVYAGGGGGAGGYSRLIASAATIGASQTVTVGALGAGGAAGNNSGLSGGDTSVGTLCIAKGGSGGVPSSVGGAGGIAGTGDIAASGAPGLFGCLSNTTVAFYSSGAGGSSQFGGGGIGAFTGSGGNVASGVAASGYGGGGSGGMANQSPSITGGGNGAKGVVFVTEFCSV